MAVTQEQIDALVTAIASGEKQVALNGGQITWRSISEMQAALATLRAEKARDDALTTPPVRRKQTYWAQGGRGF